MNFVWFLVLFSVGLILFLITSRIVAWLSIYLITRWTKVKLSIGSIGFFSLHNVCLNLSSSSNLNISRVWLTYGSKNFRKPFVICLSDLTINTSFKEFFKKKRSTKSKNKELFSTSLLRIAKWLSIHLDRIGITIEDGPLIDTVINLMVKEFTLDIRPATFDSQLQLVYFHLEQLTSTLSFSSTAAFQNVSEEIVQPCLASVSFSQTIEIQSDLIKWKTSGSDTVNAIFSDCHMTFCEDFLVRIATLPDVWNSMKVSESTKSLERIENETVHSSILNSLPKNITITVEDVEFVFEKESTRRDAVMSVKSVTFDSHYIIACLESPDEFSPVTQTSTDIIGEAICKFVVSDLFVSTGQVNFVSVLQLYVDISLKDRIATVSAHLQGSHFVYLHSDICYWVNLIRPAISQWRASRNAITSSGSHSSCGDGAKSVVGLFDASKAKFEFELNDFSATLAADANCGLQIGIPNTKASGMSKLTSDFNQQFMDGQCDLEMTSLYCKLAEDRSPSVELNSKQHWWNTMFYAGIIIAKMNRFNQSTSCDLMIDSVRLELSYPLLSTVEKILSATLMDDICDWLLIRKSDLTKHSGTKNKVQYNCQLTNINIFASCENKATVMLRCDSTTIRQIAEEMSFILTGIKAVSFIQQTLFHPIVRSTDIHNEVLLLKSCCINFKNNLKRFEVKFLDSEVFATWSMALHMCIDQVVNDVGSVVHQLKVHLQKYSSKNDHESALTFVLMADIKVNLLIQVPANHSANLMVTDFVLEKSKSRMSIKCSMLDLDGDNLKIFTCENVHIYSDHHSNRFKLERAGVNGLALPSNRAWVVSSEKFTVIFPHDYNFAEWLDQLKAINKWRKWLYKKKSNSSILPPDLCFNIKAVLVQLCDDPFEVKLGDIYEKSRLKKDFFWRSLDLLCDESLESEKRLIAMDKRVQELRRIHGPLPVNKIEDVLYASLSQKTSDVFVQRAQQLYSMSPMRTNLFQWSMKNVEVFALADSSYHGKENVVKHMKRIDPDSSFPEEGIEFSSLFCRSVRASATSWIFQLRDFPQPMLDIKEFHLWGMLIGAERAGIPSAKRTSRIDIGGPWGSITVERNMPPIKFFHDFSADIETYTMSYGSCWEPTISQVNLAFNKVSRPSLDPSPPLPFWDKFRLLLHGRLTWSIQQTSWLYHASRDPYNTTEFMDWTWTNFILDWTNAKWLLKGDLVIYSRTASKYDDCELLQWPSLRFCIWLDWLCEGDSNDHHSVMQCAPDKIPESSIKGHDSYRMFRSHGFNSTFSFESSGAETDMPKCLFYASTLRWMDKLKLCMNRTSRPIKRGRIFNRIVPRKLQLSRHLRNLKITLSVPRICCNHWTSFAKQQGIELASESLKMDVTLNVLVVPFTDGLVRRPERKFCIRQFDSELRNAKVFLCCSNVTTDKKKDKLQSYEDKICKNFLLSVDKVSYQRTEENSLVTSEKLTADDDIPVQKVMVYNLKGAWTPSNRNVVFSLFDGYVKAQILKKNLSSEALKGFKVESTSQTPKKGSKSSNANNECPSSSVFSPQMRNQSGPAYSLLQKLIHETDSKFVAVHEEMSGGGVEMEHLQGIIACKMDDVVKRNWHVELFNSQVMLTGCETTGCIIVSAAKTLLWSSDHKLVWRDDRTLKSKTTLVGSVEGMQYYATVDSQVPIDLQNIRWLTKENIDDPPAFDVSYFPVLPGLADMAGSGQCVGGVVTDTAGVTSETSGSQLQRIISRCKCQFFCAWYGEVEDDTIMDVPLPPDINDTDVMKRREGIDAFTLLHHDLEICTNSVQYATVLDIVNNLLLYVEPKKKELTEKLQNMRFKLQLASIEDLKKPIYQRQNNLRKLVARVRQLEREAYLTQKSKDEDSPSDEMNAKQQELLDALEDTKDQVNFLSEELSIMLSCFKENQLHVLAQRQSASKVQKESTTVRRIDIFFQHAEWRMTEEDGQIGIADLVLANFLYTKINGETDSGSHQLELGWFRVTNLLPDCIYTDVLIPQDPLGGAAIDHRQTALRVLCKFKSPVGGISIKEHLEVNVVPLTIQLTARFYTAAMSFFFPGKPVDSDEESEPDSEVSSDAVSIHSTSSSSSGFGPLTARTKDDKLNSFLRKASTTSNINDIDKMKMRAARNNMFLYIKIPEVPLRVSYKSEKEKHILNIHDFKFLLPPLMYQNQTWTWHDLAMALKRDCKKVIIAQAVRQKLHIKPRILAELPRFIGCEEVEKAKLLMGFTVADSKKKSIVKKNVLGKKE